MGLGLQVETGPWACAGGVGQGRSAANSPRREGGELRSRQTQTGLSDRRGDVSQEATDLSAQTPHGTHGGEERTRGTQADTRTPHRYQEFSVPLIPVGPTHRN